MKQGFRMKAILFGMFCLLPNIGHSQVGYHVSAGVTRIATVENAVSVSLFVVVEDEKGNAVDGFDRRATGPSDTRRVISVDAQVCNESGDDCRFARMVAATPERSGAGYKVAATLPLPESRWLVQGRRVIFVVRANVLAGVATLHGDASPVIATGTAVAETLGTP